MGQEQSAVLDDDTPTQTLIGRSLKDVAHYILCGQARRIVCMTGAGISTRAGSKYLFHLPKFQSFFPVLTTSKKSRISARQTQVCTPT